MTDAAHGAPPAGPLLDSPDLFRSIAFELIHRGYADEIDWQENCGPPQSPEAFALEACFVIVNSGMKHTIATRIFEKCKAALYDGASVMTVFGHEGKARAIDAVWADREALFQGYLSSSDQLDFCRKLPWIGPITVFHLLKAWGHQYAKPDIHLQRLADRHRTDPQTLCQMLSSTSGYKVPTVDLILWRACAIGVLDGYNAKMRIQPETPPPPPASQIGLFEDEQLALFGT